MSPDEPTPPRCNHVNEVISRSRDTLFDGQGVARFGDWVSGCPRCALEPRAIVAGSPSVFINGCAAAVGSKTVFIAGDIVEQIADGQACGIRDAPQPPGEGTPKRVMPNAVGPEDVVSMGGGR